LQKNSAINRSDYDAVLFDLDGVITDTATIHAACWKKMFDGFLCNRAPANGEDFRPFDLATDYRLYVDGKPRLDGVRDFLRSRGLHLPEGHHDDPSQADTVAGLGNRKNELVGKIMEEAGVEPYEGSVALIKQLRREGFKTAVVTSSENASAVLAAAKLGGFFDARVDGVTIRGLGLAGKPAPDTFLQAARLLGIEPKRAVVIEDAISGIQAGIAGGFGLVIGVERKDKTAELRRNGAEIVVGDLRELLADRADSPTHKPGP
jgi:beta-phosphoglucomutase family hydrolase